MGYSWDETERGVDKRPNQIVGKPEGLAANNTTIASHKVRPFLEPKETDHVSVAFLARAPKKFVAKLGDESVNVRREALMTMSKWLLAHPTHKATQVEAGGVEVLTKLLTDEDQTVREKAAGALSLLGSIHQGVQAMISLGTIDHLLEVIKLTESADTRKNANACLQQIGAYPDGRAAIVAGKGVPRLVEVCTEDVMFGDAMLSLKCCLQDDAGLTEALEVGACKAMVHVLHR